MKKGEVDFLSPAEIAFWKDLLEKYLFPIDDNKEERVSNDYLGLILNLMLHDDIFLLSFEQSIFTRFSERWTIEFA